MSKPNDLPRKALVTGAASGIGAAIAARLIADGYIVLAIDRDESKLFHLTKTLGSSLLPIPADLADPNIGELTLRKLQEHSISCLHAIVNVAGVSQGNSIDKITDDDWQASLDINATAPMRLLRALLPLLQDGKSAIVHIASPVAILGARKVSYSASKGALLGLNAALSQNLAPRQIRVNAILPGPTITGMTDDWSEEKRQAIAAQCPLGRLCRPEDIAGPVSFLLSEDAVYITGAVLNVTGGKSMGIGA